jgi:hypothetical protein
VEDFEVNSNAKNDAMTIVDEETVLASDELVEVGAVSETKASALGFNGDGGNGFRFN